MVEHKFDDISAAINNSGREIELDLMEKQKLVISNKTKSSQALLLPPNTSLNDNLDRIAVFGQQMMKKKKLVMWKI